MTRPPPPRPLLPRPLVPRPPAPTSARRRALAVAVGALLGALVLAGAPTAVGAIGAGLALPADAGPTAADRSAAWHAPVADVTLVGPFDAPDRPWLAGHRGVDLAAPVGTPVLAPRDGVVSFAGHVVDRPVLTVLHDDGLRGSVEPVTARVGVGDRVVAGGVVGVVADGTSHCRPTCLHWGVRDGEVYLDPWLLLHGATVVLLARDEPARHDVPARLVAPARLDASARLVVPARLTTTDGCARLTTLGASARLMATDGCARLATLGASAPLMATDTCARLATLGAPARLEPVGAPVGVSRGPPR